MNIDWKITPIRRTMVGRWRKRADYQATLMVQDHDELQESSNDEEVDEVGLTQHLDHLNTKFESYGDQVQGLISEYHR